MFYSIKDLKVKKPGSGVEMRAAHGDRMTMAFFSLAPGALIPEHAHPHEQMGTVLSGAIELIVDGEKRVVEKGGAYHIPSDVVHSGRCLDGPAEVLEVFSPPREDFMD